MLSGKLLATLLEGSCSPQPLQGEGRALQKIPWLRCSQPCCSAFSFLKQEAIHPSPPAQAAPRTQPVLPQWRPARAHTVFIRFHTLTRDYQVCDLPLQASIWQRCWWNTPEQAGMRSVFSQAQLQGLLLQPPASRLTPQALSAELPSHLGASNTPQRKIQCASKVCVPPRVTPV